MRTYGRKRKVRFSKEIAANGHHRRLAKPFEAFASANTFYFSSVMIPLCRIARSI